MIKDKRKGTEKQEKTKEVERQLVKYHMPVLSRLIEKNGSSVGQDLFGLRDLDHPASPPQQRLTVDGLGGYLLGSESCCAGTKRISNLLHCK